MTTYRTDLSIDRLYSAFETSFNWAIDQNREGTSTDLPAAWVDIVASGLDGVRLTAAPVIGAHQPPLKFIETHVISTQRFYVARSGMAGGPKIDVLLQLWFDTEETQWACGIPLIFRKVKQTGRMPDLAWADLQQLCRLITKATPSARVLFIAEKRDFDRYGESSYIGYNRLIASDANSLAGAKLAHTPLAGRTMQELCRDMASGWIGDPALSGKEEGGLLAQIMQVHQIDHVLRIRIDRDSKIDLYQSVPLPF